MGHPSHPHSLGHEKPRGWLTATHPLSTPAAGWIYVCVSTQSHPANFAIFSLVLTALALLFVTQIFFFSFCFIPISRYAIRAHVRRSRVLWSLKVEWRYGVFSWVCDQVMACRMLNYLRVKKLSTFRVIGCFVVYLRKVGEGNIS